jgi:hypothetical protein
MKPDPVLGLSLPLHGVQKQDALLELEALLNSAHFSGSRRNGPFLRYVVEEAIKGDTSNLKERILGIKVFGRSPNYETGTDPIVRATAAEVRKRIAVYYQENRPSSIRIHIPTGGYVPVFVPCLGEGQQTPPSETTTEEVSAELPLRRIVDETPSVVARQPRVRAPYSFIILVVLVGVVASTEYYHLRKAPLADAFWNPVLKSSAPILIVLGHPIQPVSATDSLYTAASKEALPVQDAISSSIICGVVRNGKRECSITSADSVTLSTMYNHSLILIGMFDNTWSSQLLSGLRFTPEPNYPNNNMLAIIDQKSGRKLFWAVDFNTPHELVTVDYAIVSRFYSSSTNGQVIIASGITGAGTEAATKFVTDSDRMSQLARFGPRGWESKNIEAVLRIEVVDGHPGQVNVVAANFW